MQKPWRAALLSAAAAALATLPGLGSGTLWDNSETSYGEVAREIVLTHDWVVMHQNGAPWFIQPPLYFWIGAVFIKIFGVTSFALRLPSALATIFMACLAAFAVARERNERAGVLTGVVLSTCLMQAVIGRLAIMDALLDAAVAAAIFWWYAALVSGRGRPFIYGCAAAALGFLAKGPVAPAIALLVIVPYALWQRRAGTVRFPRPGAMALGVAVFAVIAVPWFAALVHAVGTQSIATLIGYYTVGRYTGTIENQSGPVWYYMPALILGFFPWIAFLPSGIASAVETLKIAPRDAQAAVEQRLLRLAILWALLPLLFFSFAKTKLPNYIALEMPALAILVALYFDRALARARSISLAVSTAAVPFFVALLGVAIALFTRQNRLTGDYHALVGDLAWLGAAILAGTVIAFVALFLGAKARAASPYAIGAAMLAAMSVLALAILPAAERFKPIPGFARIIDERSTPSDAIAIMNVAGGNALMFYTRPGINVLRTMPSAQSVVCGHPRTFFITSKTAPLPPGSNPKILATSAKDNLYLFTRTCSLKDGAKEKDKHSLRR
jgi:4-amino-4-deoxy-L-arabinose transferase-like glycosyltransferase